MKTVRFAQVVARCGKPHPHAFWLTPERDKEFLAAQKAGRVMTVAPSAPGKSDVGTVGFDAEQAKNGQVLIFPKPLHAFEGARVVGIKFEELEQPPLVAGEPETPPPRMHPVRATSIHIPTDRRGPPTRQTRPDRASRSADTHAHHRRAASTPEGKKASPAAAQAKPAADRDNALRREVKAAIAELKDGKAVAAYERLQRALNKGG